MANYDIERDSVYVDNIVACRPPDNRTPTKEEVRCCWPRVKEEILARDPKTIVALGNTATQAILETRSGITATRVGPPKVSTHFPEAEIVPTFHPAACLRAADFFPSLVTDIGKAVQKVRIKWEPPKFKVFDDEMSAVLVLQELQRDYKTLVVDIEVGIEKDVDFDHPERYQFLCIGLGYAPGKVIVLGENALKSPRVHHQLKVLLETKRWIAHNGKFDLAGLRQFGTGHLWFDTMLASYVVDERAGTHGLKYLAVEILGAPKYDDDLSRYVGKGDSYAVVPRNILYTYNAMDVACTWLLYEYYTKILTGEGMWLHDFLVECSNELMKIEMDGIHVDEKHLDYLTNHYLDGLDDLEGQLHKWVDNPRSPKQVKEALDKLGFKVTTTNEEQLRALLERVEPGSEMNVFLSLMLEHRREQKLYGTYVKGIRKRMYEGKVHPTFLLHGTTTGRLACRNPNLQNVPRESSIRSLFVPAEGNVFVQGDYEQAELRVVFSLAEEQGEVYDILNDPTRNIFDELTTELYGPGWKKEDRIRTKAFVHGTNYGREYYSIAKEYKMSPQEGQALQQKWLTKIPKVVEWQRDIRRRILKEQEDLVTPFGRHRRFWLITEENKRDVLKEGLAFLPQSIASDINLAAGVRLRADGLSVRLLVHDSTLVECSRADQDAVAKHMKEVMERTALMFTDFIRFPVEIKIGNSWGEL